MTSSLHMNMETPSTTNYEISVRADPQKSTIDFDMQLRQTSRELTLIIAPKVRNGSYNGCVVVYMHRRDKQAVVQTLKHDSKCAKNMTLERKYGTRLMILGALHVAIHFGAERMPHVKTFVLSDESSFECSPLSNKLKTIVTDVLLLDDTYYARHLNMKPETQRSKDILEDARKALANEVDLSFSVFWERIFGKGKQDERLANTQTPEQKDWLQTHKDEIKIIYKDTKRDEATWRVLFQRLYRSYGCTFFASCALRLVDMFRLNGLVGASWVVKFKDLPSQVNGHDIKVQLRPMIGGNAASSKAHGRLGKLYLKQRAFLLL